MIWLVKDFYETTSGMCSTRQQLVKIKLKITNNDNKYIRYVCRATNELGEDMTEASLVCRPLPHLQWVKIWSYWWKVMSQSFYFINFTLKSRLHRLYWFSTQQVPTPSFWDRGSIWTDSTDQGSHPKTWSGYFWISFLLYNLSHCS